MNVPWARLSLARFRAVVDGDGVLFQNGEAMPEAESASAEEGSPRVVYGSTPAGSPAETYDVRQMARVLHPTLADHELRTICAYHGVPFRPDRPARSLGEVFGALVDEAIRLDRGATSLISQLLSDPLAGLFARALVLEGGPATPEPREGDAGGAIERPTSREAFGPTGLVAQHLPGYEERPGQVAMADAVTRTLAGGGALVVEAGPGTGKTFSYLIPAIELLVRDETARVVVSTRTKQLQEQLFVKDLPLLRNVMAPDLRVALLKGRENYLCLRRWDLAVRELSEGLERDRLSLLAPLARWLWETETGDIDENVAFLADPAGRDLWRRLCDSPLHCIDPVCSHGDECFSIRARRRARSADLVVVNHSLLLNDLTVDRRILGTYTHLVIDEAHALEETARSAFTATLAPRTVDRLADALAPVRRPTGWLHRLPSSRTDASVRATFDVVGTLRTVASSLFDEVGRRLPKERRGELPTLVESAPVLERMTTVADRLESSIEGLIEASDDPEIEREGAGLSGSVRELGNLCRLFAAPRGADVVHWYERESGGIALHVTPLDVAPILAETLYPELGSVILTSATLSVGGDFNFVIRALGLDLAFKVVESEIVESPFSFEDHMRICVPASLPDVTEVGGRYAEALAAFVSELAERLDRKGLVLFTSYRLLDGVRGRLPGAVVALAQGADGPRSKLIERFKRSPEGVLLFGTDSFWEGVDFPGEELEYVVVTRLPFAVPTDPIQMALADLYVRRGRDSFLDLALPRAVLKLRQGVGRLIRTQRDRGAVILTDRRVLSRGYGRAFASALPVRLEVFESSAELVDEIGAWFEAT